MKFKVGDRVKINPSIDTSDWVHDVKWVIGKTLTITEVLSVGDNYKIKGTHYAFNERELILVNANEMQKLKEAML